MYEAPAPPYVAKLPQKVGKGHKLDTMAFLAKSTAARNYQLYGAWCEKMGGGGGVGGESV